MGRKTDHLNILWLDPMLGFIQKIYIQVLVTSLWLPLKEGVNDVSIISVIEKEIEQKNLGEINKCWMFFRVTMVSDFATSYGKNKSCLAMEGR